MITVTCERDIPSHYLNSIDLISAELNFKFFSVSEEVNELMNILNGCWHDYKENVMVIPLV